MLVISAAGKVHLGAQLRLDTLVSEDFHVHLTRLSLSLAFAALAARRNSSGCEDRERKNPSPGPLIHGSERGVQAQ